MAGMLGALKGMRVLIDPGIGDTPGLGEKTTVGRSEAVGSPIWAVTS